MCRIAAEGGYLHIVRWLHAEGAVAEADTCKAAAEGGHLDVLAWTVANDFPWEAEQCFIAAKKQGQVEVCEWIKLHAGENFTFDL